MDIVVKGRNVEVPDHFRIHTTDKLGRVERYDQKIIRIDVELFHEPNPRQAAACQRVEITCKSRGPVVRGEASAKDFYSALDAATAKFESRLSRSAERRRTRRDRSTKAAPTVPAEELVPVGELSLPGGGEFGDSGYAAVNGAGANGAGGGRSAVLAESVLTETESSVAVDHEDDTHQPGQIVREKQHAAIPMTIDQALFEMELVGHDFYLFQDADAGRASVVYRRKGYDYGVIRLVES